MNKILSLIPCGIIKVEDAMKLAEVIEIDEYKKGKRARYVNESYRNKELAEIAIRLLQSFESLYALKLEKGHFVPPKRPVRAEYPLTGLDSMWDDAIKAYNEANEKVIFEGFEPTTNTIRNGGVSIIFNYYSTILNTPDGTTEGVDKYIETIGDLFTEIERYNRTSPAPIELKYTSNILSLLKIEG